MTTMSYALSRVVTVVATIMMLELRLTFPSWLPAPTGRARAMQVSTDQSVDFTSQLVMDALSESVVRTIMNKLAPGQGSFRVHPVTLGVPSLSHRVKVKEEDATVLVLDQSPPSESNIRCQVRACSAVLCASGVSCGLGDQRHSDMGCDAACR